jgi:hypothetical protein
MNKVVMNQLMRTLAALVLIAGLTTIVYYPGLHGPFVFDDAHQILNNPAIALSDLSLRRVWAAAISNQTDFSERPLTTLSFALNHYLGSGTGDTYSYKVTGLIIHILNAWLIYWICILLLRSPARSATKQESRIAAWTPLIVTLTWAVHPLNLTSVLYVSQRSTLISALFVLAGLILFTYGRIRVDRNARHGYSMMLAGLAGGIAFGFTGKENAVLLGAYVLVVEFTVFRMADWHKGLSWFYGLTVFLPAALVVFWVIAQPQVILENYNWRHFTLGERLLTETRVLWFYVSLILLPDTRRFSLFHDDIGISHSLVDPWITLPAVLGLLAVTAFALLRAHRHPALSLAILWFLAGHLLESTVVGLEIAHEHRNYLPTFGPILGIVLVLTRFLDSRRGITATAIPAALVAIFGFATLTRAQVWSDNEKIIQHMVANHPSSPLAHAMNAQQVLVRNGDVSGALAEYRKASELAPHEAGYLILAAIITAQSRTVSTTERPLASGPSAAVPETGQGTMLDEAMLADISRRLAASPIGSTTEASLKQLHDYLLSAPPCHSLCANAEAWYRLVLDNRRASPMIHGNVAIYLADLYMHQNRFADALRIAEEWIKRRPTDLNYRLIAADAHLHLDSLDDAEQAILSIKSSPRGADYREATDFLLDKIGKRRERLHQK